MSTSDCLCALESCFTRAMNAADPYDRAGIRRAFRRAARAASDGDARPTVLLTYRYP